LMQKTSLRELSRHTRELFSLSAMNLNFTVISLIRFGIAVSGPQEFNKVIKIAVITFVIDRFSLSELVHGYVGQLISTIIHLCHMLKIFV